jgi:hypothetical protein
MIYYHVMSLTLYKYQPHGNHEKGGTERKKKKKDRSEKPPYTSFFLNKKKQSSPIFSNMVTLINIITTTLNTFIPTISLSNSREPKNQSL